VLLPASRFGQATLRSRHAKGKNKGVGKFHFADRSKRISGKTQEKFKTDAQFACAGVGISRGNAADEAFSMV
jgi:hypothetical protein